MKLIETLTEEETHAVRIAAGMMEKYYESEIDHYQKQTLLGFCKFAQALELMIVIEDVFRSDNEVDIHAEDLRN